jgi:hypothetical protein
LKNGIKELLGEFGEIERGCLETGIVDALSSFGTQSDKAKRAHKDPSVSLTVNFLSFGKFHKSLLSTLTSTSLLHLRIVRR